MNRMMSLWVFSLLVVGTLASVVTAQVARQQPRVVTGGDLGFRIDGIDMKGRPTGSIVIRVNGEWVETGEPMKATHASTGW